MSPEQPSQLYGIVLEVGTSGGLDLLAAYSDLHTRYYSYSGAGIVWEHPNATLDSSIKKLLDSARLIAERILPWEGATRTLPSKGSVRINLLTRSGWSFGEGTFEAMSKDAMAGPVLSAATELMKAMTQKALEAKKQ